MGAISKINDTTLNNHVHEFNLNDLLVCESGVYCKCIVEGCRMCEKIENVRNTIK